MARFQFRLATLLRLRELARDERRTQLAEVLRLVDQMRERRTAITTLLEETRKLEAAPSGAVDVDRLLNATRYELVLQSELRQLEVQETTLTTEIEKRRQALVAADREVRSLELLRETQQQRHLADEASRLQKELDEIAVRRHAREHAE